MAMTMQGMSNKMIAIFNFIVLLCIIPIIWLVSKTENQLWVHLFRNLVLGFLVILFIVSLLGFLGSYWNNEDFLLWYLLPKAIFIIVFLLTLIIFFAGTIPDGSYVVPGKGYKEYRLHGFSSLLRNVTEQENWNKKIKTSVAESNVCSKLTQDFNSSHQFSLAHLSPVQSGCCKPPTICGYTYVNPTLWVNSTNPGSDHDCYVWSNNQTQLCYGCDTCNAGLLGSLREELRKSNMIMLVTFVVLLYVYLMEFMAYHKKNAESQTE